MGLPPGTVERAERRIRRTATDPADTLFHRKLNKYMRHNNGRMMDAFVKAIVKRAVLKSDRLAIEIIARLDGKLPDVLVQNDQNVVVLPNWMGPNSPPPATVPRETPEGTEADPYTDVPFDKAAYGKLKTLERRDLQADIIEIERNHNPLLPGAVYSPVPGLITPPPAEGEDASPPPAARTAFDPLNPVADSEPEPHD